MSGRDVDPSLDEDRLHRLGIAHLTEPGDPRVSGLVDDLGAAVVHEGLLRGLDLQGVELDAAARVGATEPARVLERAHRSGLRFVVPGDTEWPAGLDDLGPAAPVARHGGRPLGVWVRGPLGLHEIAASVAVVGARAATTYGTDVASRIAAGVAATGRAVVSGAAFGIDQSAHRGALAVDGRTVGVLACGADRVYPQAHARLIEHLADEHCLVSETVPGGAPTRMRFLSRNRLIAALTEGTVVVEAALRSGALNTANWAGRLHRHLMGVPGPVTSTQSAGVHQLVRESGALLVTHPDEVLEVVAPAGEQLTTRARGEDRARDRLTHRQQQVLEAVPLRRAADDFSIAGTAGVAPLEVRGTLLTLEEAGFVRREGVGWRLADHDPQLPDQPFLDWTG
ncbi:DNA-processing protein DprA [uncultured Nocardioides sp.]|uniref:DNA-processing protein DprA n=1 Tax=uncultured Nocardioides sp. TaxID=198441 RepID=UPI00260E33D0|nr:DNA-processing protein DprA [uncultured Nocardioides sp.]